MLLGLVEGHSPAGGSGTTPRSCVSLWESACVCVCVGGANVEWHWKMRVRVSACVSDDRSVLGGGGRPMMQTRCARDEGHCTNRGENETDSCLYAAVFSTDCKSGTTSLRTDHIWQSVNIILALISSCFIWLHKSCGLHAASAVTGLSSWRNDMIMAVWKEMLGHYFMMWRVSLIRQTCTFQSQGKGINNWFICERESKSYCTVRLHAAMVVFSLITMHIALLAPNRMQDWYSRYQ